MYFSSVKIKIQLSHAQEAWIVNTRGRSSICRASRHTTKNWSRLITTTKAFKLDLSVQHSHLMHSFCFRLALLMLELCKLELALQLVLVS